MFFVFFFFVVFFIIIVIIIIIIIIFRRGCVAERKVEVRKLTLIDNCQKATKFAKSPSHCC